MTLCGSHCARYASSPKRVNRVSRDAFTHFPPVPDLGTKLFPRTSAQGAQELAIKEPLLGGFLYSKILNQPTFERSLAFLLATKLATSTILASQWNDLIIDAITTSAEEEQNKSPGAGSIAAAARADLEAIKYRDPACPSYVHAFLFYKGFQGLQAQRVSHWLWGHKRKVLACMVQSSISETFGMDLHPGAKFGRGIMIDHATGIVVGETAVVDDDCSLFHGVTLGGTGKEAGDRHPKLQKRVGTIRKLARAQRFCMIYLQGALWWVTRGSS